MAKKEITTEQPAEFPLTLEEFLNELPPAQVETRAGFNHVMEQEKETAPRLRGDWLALLELYHIQPTAMSWAEWAKPKQDNEGGNGTC